MLIVCVGNNSPIRKAWSRHGKRPGPQTSEAPQGTDPRRTTAGTTAASTQKGQRRAKGGTSDSHKCRRPRVPWRQARRLHRQPNTPGRTGPWARRPKGPPPHKSGPSKASRARPRHTTAESGPALARAFLTRRGEITNAPAASSTGRAWWWGGGRTKMMSEAESKARPDT